MALLEAQAGCQQTNESMTTCACRSISRMPILSNRIRWAILLHSSGGMVVSANEMQKDKGQLKFRTSAWRVPKRPKGSCL